jgi:CheY-like chemotaxis protein
VIVMDLSLPVMDGWEATQRLKRDRARSVVSGRTRLRVRATARRVRPGHHEALPAGSLMDALRRILDIKARPSGR